MREEREGEWEKSSKARNEEGCASPGKVEVGEMGETCEVRGDLRGRGGERIEEWREERIHEGRGVV